MKPQTSFRVLALLCATVLAVACGGGGSGGNSIAGIDRTGGPSFALAFGTITGFGSIIVNGVHYDTSSSSFEIDGQPGSQDDLKVGDVVLVQGTIASNGTSGTASSVSFDDAVEGPIEFLDAGTATLIVLGQTVQITADTSFDDRISPPSIDGLTEGDIVEVSGFVDAAGAISATRIEPKDGTTQFEVTGTVASHVPGTSFVINGLTVNYQAAQLQDFPGGVISDGDLVEVKGSVTLGPNGELAATRVEFKGGQLTGNANTHLEIEGLITRFASQTDFDVSGVTVSAAAGTVFEGDTNNLGLNVKVEVEGTLNASNVLIATKVDIRRARVVRIEAAVDSVDAAAGTFVTLGVTIAVDSLTRMEDKFANPPVEPFTLNDLNANDFVRIRGSMASGAAATADVVAALLERDDPRNTELQGFVESVSIPTLTVLGVTVETSGGTVFRAADGSTLSSSQFFAQVQGGDLVKATGTETGATTVVADEVQLESAL